MKKYLISFFLIIAFAFYLLLNNQSSMDVGPSAGNPVAVVTPSANPTASTKGAPIVTAPTPAPGVKNPAPTPAPAPVPAPAPAAAAYKDGTYTGSVADAYFGSVQVAAVIKSGQLSNVNILQYPNDSGHSRAVSNSSLPQLVQEAVQAQNANVNIVSGATQTSQAFQQSLADALAQAKS